MSPAVRRIYERFLPADWFWPRCWKTCISRRPGRASDRPGSDGRQRLRMQYRLHASEIERRAAFLRQLKEVFKPFRKIPLGSGKDNTNLVHVCGTCRFGTDPKTSVLDRKTGRTKWTTFMWWTPRSSVQRRFPSFTVAANALRVAEHIDQTQFAS